LKGANRNITWSDSMLFLLVEETTGGGFETLGGDKTHGFISTIKSLQKLNKSSIHTLSLFL